MNERIRSKLSKCIKIIENVASSHPKLVVSIRYLFRFGTLPNLSNPKSLNEKILYLKLNSDTSRWTYLADKYKVREYVKFCGLQDILIPLYGIWKHPSEIDFNLLPQQFMIKANNGDGKGTNKVINKDQLSKTDYQNLYMILEEWISRKNIGALSAEPQYKNIPPRIIAEKVLHKQAKDTSLIDYKIWCFNGKPHSILVCYNRHASTTCLGCYDLTWTFQPYNMRGTKHFQIATTPLPKPIHLDEMIKIAAKLSKPFPQVRVDLYEAENKVWFGELTFTSLGGLMNYYTNQYLMEMGNLVDLKYSKNIGYNFAN